MVAIHGLEQRRRDTAFAFVVLELRIAVGRDELEDVLRFVAPLVPDIEGFLDELPDDFDDPQQLVAVPWLPAEVASGVEAQRRLLERASAVGVAAAWCFQTAMNADDDVAPPQAGEVRFPIDDDEAIDEEDLGIAFKLAGEPVGGEEGVLAAFHELWLAPYGDGHQDAAFAYDREHHSAHLWAVGLATSRPAGVLAAHLRWIASKIDEIIPLVHARFARSSEEAFVLGGNPLLALHAAGEAAVDAWIAGQREWSSEEVARMLRELAVDLVTHPRANDDDDDEQEPADDEDAAADRHLATFAGELLRARAAAGKLDPRAADKLLPVLGTEGGEHRRRAVVELLGAVRHRAAVPALLRILDGTRIDDAHDSVSKEGLVASTALALGAIEDPSAIAALARVVAAPGSHNDRPRAAAATALAACLARVPEPRDVDDAVLAGLLATIRDRNDGELNAEAHFAYGRLARVLRPERREEARRWLADVDSARDDTAAMLARHAALVLAAPAGLAPPPAELRALLHEALTALDYDHEYTVRNIRIALRVGEALPDLVDARDLLWLTRLGEPDIRASAHALLAYCGLALAPAPIFDRTNVRELDDRELVRWLGETHVVHRAALVAEAGRRRLRAAWPAIVDLCHDVITRARQGGANLLDPDRCLLAAAVPLLRVPPLDDAAAALFDRMLRHSNVHVKWELLQAPPHDERLIGGMFHVLGERWGWQEKAAKQWLARFVGTPAYDAERRRAGSADREPEPDPDLETN